MLHSMMLHNILNAPIQQVQNFGTFWLGLKIKSPRNEEVATVAWEVLQIKIGASYRDIHFLGLGEPGFISGTTHMLHMLDLGVPTG